MLIQQTIFFKNMQTLMLQIAGWLLLCIMRRKMDEKNTMVSATHPMISIPELKSEIPQPPHAAVPNCGYGTTIRGFVYKEGNETGFVLAANTLVFCSAGRIVRLRCVWCRKELRVKQVVNGRVKQVVIGQVSPDFMTSACFFSCFF